MLKVLLTTHEMACHICTPGTFTFTFTFGEDSMLSSAEAIIKFGPMQNPEITERLYESL